jgi:hypothetical protein
MRTKLLSEDEGRTLALVVESTPERVPAQPFAHPGRACTPHPALASIRSQS